MRKQVTIVLLGCLIVFGWMATDLSAQGGRRGGGGRSGGGASRGGSAGRSGMQRGGMQRGGSPHGRMQRGGGAGRTPSMNHNMPSHRQQPGHAGSPSQRPGNRPSAGARPETGSGRPSSNQLQSFLDLPAGPANAHRPGQRTPSSAANQMASPRGGAANAFLQHGPDAGQAAALNQRVANGPLTQPGQRPANSQLAQHLPSQITNNQQWSQSRQNRITEVNGQVANRFPDRGDWFNQGFWEAHPNMRYPLYNPAHGGAYWWTGATWGSLNSWMPYAWLQPASYNYGDNVYYQGDQVYSNGQPVASADDYAQQAQQIANSQPSTMPSNDDWMPLGVFAMTPDGQSSGAEPTMFMQLAVSKQGVIAGTYQNRATGSVQSIEGAVDKSSQRAAWTVGGKSSPIVDAGIVNLTQESAPVLLHFADGSTQQWLLARLQPPQSGS